MVVYGNDSADLSPEFLLYKEEMLFNLLKHKLIFRLSSIMEAELTGRKVRKGKDLGAAVKQKTT
jgi:hypothetical protein